jgi:hypothetical protein
VMTLSNCLGYLPSVLLHCLNYNPNLITTASAMHLFLLLLSCISLLDGHCLLWINFGMIKGRSLLYLEFISRAMGEEVRE